MQTVETFTLEMSIPTDHLGSADMEVVYDDGVMLDVRLNGRSIGPEAGQILLEAISTRPHP